MFTCTGSEANDLAYPHRARPIPAAPASSSPSSPITASPTRCRQFSPSLGQYVPLGAHVRTVPAPDAYRRRPAPDLGECFADDVRAALADMKRARHQAGGADLSTRSSPATACFAEPAGFLQEAVDGVREAGGAVHRRRGAARLRPHRRGACGASSATACVPDIVTMGKPMGNGHPDRGHGGRPRIVLAFGGKRRGISTPSAATPSPAPRRWRCCDVIERDRLMENAARVGAYMMDGLRQLG